MPAVEVTMPRLSDTMERGTVVRWLVEPGQEIKKGQPLAEIETDKATMEFESYVNGKVDQLLLPAGQSVAIGTPIAVVQEAGGTSAAPAPSAPTEKKPEPAALPPSPAVASGAPASVVTTASAEPGERIKVTPIARQIAAEHGLELAQIAGTGPGGRITKEDVEGYLASQTMPRETPIPSPAKTPAPSLATAVGKPLTRLQQTVAERMTQSKTTIPHFYVTIEVDMSAATRLREQLNRAWQPVRVGYNDFIVKAVGLALRSDPQVNASWQNNSIILHDTVNVGVAVTTENGGLLVPVLHDVDKTDLRTLVGEMRALIQRTREGKALAGDYSGGRFTVSNLGMYGVDQFLAIINLPESGILAVGQIAKRPVVQDNQVVVSERMTISLSGDHRVFYGVQGAEFIAEVKKLLENPLALLK